jgi:hypothetical protein
MVSVLALALAVPPTLQAGLPAVDPLVALAFLLLVAGVVGSVVPLLPGAGLSTVGVLVYWYATGFARPGPVVLAALVIVGLFGVAVDLAGGALAAKAGGASTATTALAAVVGIVATVLAGPVGLLVGVAGTVFLVEFARHRDAEASGRSALFATVGVLASGLVQLTVTASMLLAVVLVTL